MGILLRIPNGSEMWTLCHPIHTDSLDVSVRLSCLSAAAPGELSGQRPPNLPSQGWVTAEVFGSKSSLIGSMGRNKVFACIDFCPAPIVASEGNLHVVEHWTSQTDWKPWSNSVATVNKLTAHTQWASQRLPSVWIDTFNKMEAYRILETQEWKISKMRLKMLSICTDL